MYLWFADSCLAWGKISDSYPFSLARNYVKCKHIYAPSKPFSTKRVRFDFRFSIVYRWCWRSCGHDQHKTHSNEGWPVAAVETFSSYWVRRGSWQWPQWKHGHLTHWSLGNLNWIQDIISNFQVNFSDWLLRYALWNCSQMHVTGHYCQLMMKSQHWFM